MRSVAVAILLLALSGCSMFRGAGIDTLEAAERVRLQRPMTTLLSRYVDENQQPLIVYTYREARTCLLYFLWAEGGELQRETEEVTCEVPPVEEPRLRRIGDRWLVYGRTGGQGAQSVTVRFADGTSANAPVVNGFYHILGDKPIQPQSAELKVAG